MNHRLFLTRVILVVSSAALTLPAFGQQIRAPAVKTTSVTFESKVKAGFGVADITPSPGADMPYGYTRRVGTGVHDRLLVNACVVYDGTTPVALAGVDALFIDKETVQQARRAIFEATKIPGQNVLIGVNHTHTGGPIISGRASKADPAYVEKVVQAIASAVTDAWQSLHAAELGVGTGKEDAILFNRRFLMRDGREITHPGKPHSPHHDQIVAPAGPIDPDVGVLAVRTPRGKVTGVIVNYACHNTTMSGDKFSPDYVGYLRRHLKASYGEQTSVVFLLGACGDVTQVDNMSIGAQSGPEYANMFGAKLAAETVRTIGRMSWLKEASVAVAVENVLLPIRPEMDPERETPAFGHGTGQPEFWAAQRRLVAEERQRTPKIDCEVQAIRIGPLALVTNGAELFCEYGLRIKKASELKPTWVVTLANEYIGYVCTPQAFVGGGYEPRTATSSKMGIESGQLLVETSLTAITRIGPPRKSAQSQVAK
ncbi:MAG: hypothetical protein ACREH8_10900 [Opitutaceae bacterium]